MADIQLGPYNPEDPFPGVPRGSYPSPGPGNVPGAPNYQPPPPDTTPKNPWGDGPRPSVGRYKVDGSGNQYWDPNDTGLDQTAGGGGGGGGQGGSGSAGGANYAGTSVFGDPATAQWEKLLNARIAALQTPYNNPAFQPAIDQLTQYLQRLNGPAYTPAQMDLMQTQTLDPLEHQRSQAKQQIIQRMAAHGVGPGSGILEKALQDADQQFNALRTKTQAGFATGAIGQDNQNAASAAALAPQIASMYQQQFNAQDARDNQAVSMAGVIPQTAWDRLTGANSLVQQTNPLSALQLAGGFQQQGYQQSQDFTGGLMSILSLLMGL
jgi:hypothetical protein